MSEIKKIMKIDLTKPHVHDLLVLFGDLLDELQKRGIVRSRNNPVADYAEWIVAQALGLKLQTSSNKGFDAVDKKGIKYQIKGRRLHPGNPSRQLGVIRSLKKHNFDFLIAVLFDKDFSILEAYKIPHRLISKYSHYSKHQNGHILQLKGKTLSAKGVENITEVLRKASA